MFYRDINVPPDDESHRLEQPQPPNSTTSERHAVIAVTDRRDAGDGESPTTCPHCGRRATGLRVVGLTEAYLSPCGCQIAPGLLGGFEN